MLALGCTDPVQGTDIRHGGPPEVLAVLVQNDPSGMILEAATFCKTKGPADGTANAGDPKRPGLVGTPDGLTHQICPDDLTKGVDELANAWPEGWYVRIMFDRLLDPAIEDLSVVPGGDPTNPTYMGSIANTKPVQLQCQSVTGGTLVDIPYDGYYSPAGNSVTWPLGPSLVVKPNNPALIATSKECQITINGNVLDKEQGQPVYTDQRGPYKFKIAPVTVVALTPTDGSPVDAIAAGVDVTFNTTIDPTTFNAPLEPPDGTESFDFTPHVPFQVVTGETPEEVLITGDFVVNGMFTWAMKAGTKVKDQCGQETTFGPPSVKDLTQTSFTTNALKSVGVAPFDGAMTAAPNKFIALSFNQYMDPGTVDPLCDGTNPCTGAPTKFSITCATAGACATTPVVGLTVTDLGDGNLTFFGAYQPNADYTFTLKGGTTIKDCPGEEDALGNNGTFACTSSPMGGTYTNATDQVIHFHTAPITLTSISPKDNGTVTKASATSGLTITLSFNQLMNGSSLASTDYSISPALTLAATGAGSVKIVTPGKCKIATTTSCAQTADCPAATGESCVLTPVPAGSYTFTLKGSATIKDVLGNSFSPGTDKVIHFTVKDPPPPTPPPPACY